MITVAERVDDGGVIIAGTLGLVVWDFCSVDGSDGVRDSSNFAEQGTFSGNVVDSNANRGSIAESLARSKVVGWDSLQ